MITQGQVIMRRRSRLITIKIVLLASQYVFTVASVYPFTYVLEIAYVEKVGDKSFDKTASGKESEEGSNNKIAPLSHRLYQVNLIYSFYRIVECVTSFGCDVILINISCVIKR